MRSDSRHLAFALALLGGSFAAPCLAAEQYAFVLQWGSRDIAPGYFNFTRGLAVDRSCNLYVADGNNNRMQKFSSVGVLLGVWGSAGAGPGQFSDPYGVAVDSSGIVYVTDFGNHRVQRFTGSGGYLSQWGQHGSADGYFDYPTGVAADRFGNIYTTEPLILSDSSNARIQRFTSTGAFVAKWHGVFSPEDVAVDTQGNLFVLDANSVTKYASTGTLLLQWGVAGTGPGQFNDPQGLCVDGAGDVYVADSGNNRIQKFNGSGGFLTQWGGFGGGPGKFNFPSDVVVDDSGSVYVGDALNYRIQKFRANHPPVLLVHGICGKESDWDPFAQVVSDSGFAVDRIQYGTGAYSLRPAAYVNALAAKLDSMGSDHIAVVTHSMGGLIAREYMRRQIAAGRPNKISQLVTLGTPHHGSDFLAKLLDMGWVGPIAALVDPCLGSSYSRPALLDMVPGAWFLNRLNYGTQPSPDADTVRSHGWDSHHPETGIAGGVYYATIAGTGTYCFAPLSAFFWGKGSGYHANDGVVAAGSSMLTTSAVFRARDVDLPLAVVNSHTPLFSTPCDVAYYASPDLASKVARILVASPAAPPVQGPDLESPPLAEAIQATADDSLQMLAPISGSIGAGQLATQTLTIPATTLFKVALLSSDAHLSLQDPNGASIGPNDTSTVNGVSFFSTPGPGFEGFELAHPLPGTWTLRIDATASGSAQAYGCAASLSTAVSAQLSVISPLIYPGDSIRVRATATDGSSVRADAVWSCQLRGPDNTTTPLTLVDDGAHGDSLPGDGIFGAVLAPTHGVGSYDLNATAIVPGSGPFMATAHCELADAQDLAIQSGDIYPSRNVPQAGDSLTVFAVVHNNSTVAALGVPVDIRDLRTGSVLATSTVDIAAGGSVTVQAPWVPAPPDSHTIRVQISPNVLDESNYANNTASRLFVLGSAAGVGPGTGIATLLRFDPPRPNPTTSGVVFSFHLPRAAAATLSVYDVLGRRVRVWRWEALPPGAHSVAWDGRDSKGVRAATGVYVCRLEVGNERLTHKVVLRR